MRKITTLNFVPGEKVNGWIGVSESLLGISIFGIVFALFSGQPIIIVGATGPKLVFEAALYQVSLLSFLLSLWSGYMWPQGGYFAFSITKLTKLYHI